MATVNKDFKIKSGLIVEGTTATVNGFDVLTKKQADQDYVVNLIGGTATSANEANKVVKRDANGDFSAGKITADLTGDVTGNADTATALETSRTIELTGDVTGSVSFDGTANVQISTTLDGSFATDAEVATAKSEAIADASADATSKANAAMAAAESFATAADTALYGTVTSDIATAKSEAISAASSDATTKSDAALVAAKAYTDQEVADLVAGAPALLDTLNELAEAIADNPNYATDVANLVATKADTSYVNSEISDLDTAAQGYASAAQTAAEATASADATSKANAAKAAAEATASADATSKANTAEQNAIAHADALTTSDIAEGTSQYFTDVRAKTSAAALIVGATKTNITITGDENGLTISAENGVADSDTDDLVEGSTNLYFTDSRVTTAIANATHIAPQAIDITWVRREEATWTDVATASKATCHSASTSEGSMKYLVRVTASVGGTRHSHVTEVLATVDGSNGVAVVEYGTIYTSTEPLATVTVEWNAGTSKYDLNVTTANNNSEVMVAATLMATLD